MNPEAKSANSELKTTSSIKDNNSINNQNSQEFGWSKSLTLKTKTTLFAIAIGTIPLLAIGGTAYYFANKSITKQIIEIEETETVDLQDKVNRFMKERFSDIQVMADLDIFIDSAATVAQKTAALERLRSAKAVYDSIGVFDLQGEPIAQTKQGKKLGNHLNRTYIQSALKVNGAVLSQPTISTTSGTFSVYAASTIKDRNTGKPIGFIRARLPVTALEEVIQNVKVGNKQYYLLNETGEVFLGPEGEYITQTKSSGESATNDDDYESLSLEQIFSSIESIQGAEQVSTTIATNLQKNTQQLLSYAPPVQIAGLPDLNWKAILVKDTDIAFAPQRQFGFTLLTGTGIATLLVAAIASYLANSATIPLVDAVIAVKKIGGGKLDTRLSVKRNDELGQLGSNINLMTNQIQNLIQEQKVIADRQKQEKEQLEAAIYTLLDEVYEATDGDLTVRANLDNLELSTVADLFNAIITNLHDIAVEAKESSGKVGSSLKQNEMEMRLLAKQAIQEAQETRETLMSVEQLSQSIQTVATNASQAEQIADATYNTIVSSTNNMDLTVESILTLRTTVDETGQKMERLNESSKQISEAISLIEGIALKTNVLAINAGAEAERAGEYGQGFAIVAEQVSLLAKQSTAALKEIARTVTVIQAETNEVNQAMKSGTTQVLETFLLIESTKESLSLALEKSRTINQLMESISHSTISQTTTSESVTNLMQNIAQLSETTSKSSERVAKSIVETANVAERLESTVSQFKVSESV